MAGWNFGDADSAPLADTNGVAVALDGAPLMRFSYGEGAASQQTDAYTERLASIAKRGKEELTSCTSPEEPLQAAAVQRRFWTPEEVEHAGSA